ncbi:hypothetical protein NB696_002252 [Xanthomonas sacchari]|nr:hypothetical protein [Xanthomonas sacchari]MCW0445380.1 hypothetical protein [Xanthomonas sacchari]
MPLPGFDRSVSSIMFPRDNIGDFMDFIAAATPDQNIYLFGGVIRDLALFGKRGFNSDIDIVVDGDISQLFGVLDNERANKNKFGGYRFNVGDWPVDIWSAEDTWAIKKGFVDYKGASSLIRTTVLNWDAILMNWRTRSFICAPEYLDSLKERKLDVVLEENPNPLGMAVRVFRHLSSKDARKISISAFSYLEKCTESFSFEELKNAEMKSYGSNLIEPMIYLFFSQSRGRFGVPKERFQATIKDFVSSGLGVGWGQLKLDLS